MEVFFLLVLFILMIGALSSGFPVAFALPGSSMVALGLAALFGYLVEGDVSAYFLEGGPVEWLTAGVTNFRSLYWDVERDTLIAVPLFIFMGIMLERSKIAEDLLDHSGKKEHKGKERDSSAPNRRACPPIPNGRTRKAT